jgi:hypothetical protein
MENANHKDRQTGSRPGLHLRRLASSRLLPILKEVQAKPEYAERMANEKYDIGKQLREKGLVK